jgi:hypothetical protein
MNCSAAELTCDQIVSYHVNGYLTVDAVASPEDVRSMRAIYDDLFARRVGREKGDQFDLGGGDEEGKEARLPQILAPSKYAPELAQTGTYAKARSVARQLLGPLCEFIFDHAINKPPRDGAATPWHQDEAYWDPGKLYESLSIWIPLQPATLDNGCMQFIPGSHKLNIVEHRSIGGDVRVHGLEICEPSVDLSSAVACPIPAGAATIHHNRTMHYAGPNRSDQWRRALILVFGLPAKPYPHLRRFLWNEAKQTARAGRANVNETS